MYKKINITLLVSCLILFLIKKMDGTAINILQSILLVIVCWIVISYPFIIGWNISRKNGNKKAEKIVITCWVMMSIYIGYESIKMKMREVPQRLYQSEYKGRIEKKYPKEFAKAETYRQMILKSIKSEKRRIDNLNIYIDYFDEKGRLIYKVEQSRQVSKVNVGTSKGSSMYKEEVFPPKEEGYIYDKDGKMIHKLIVPEKMPYRIEKFNENNFYTYLKAGGPLTLAIDITYPKENERVEIEYDCSTLNWANMLDKKERKYINNILINEKEMIDDESNNGFIKVNIEKKYNEKGELIYKTVERKDKTNDYKSFTEMDFAKDEIVTKYYKGKDVFATVTENLVGPVETIEETEMVNGEKVKKVYKNKVKAIVKRQKVGEPVRIVDIQTYDSKKLVMKVERCIFDEKGNLKYKYTGVKGWKETYLADSVDFPMEDGYLHESFYATNFDSNENYKYLGDFKLVEKFDIESNKIVSFEPIHEIEIKECNLELGNIEEKNMKLKGSREMKKNEKITLEELLNGYKYE